MVFPSLLATKIRIPPQSQWIVARTPLLEVLEVHVPQHRLTLVAAPAGYGKTTLLSEWARHSRRPVAWLSLAEEDNEPAHFYRYLLAAWQEVQPEIGESPLALLLGAQGPEIQTVLRAFVNAGSELADHLVFVLDDYHFITEPSIHEGLTFLLDHLPPTLHFVLSGRGEPALPIARYRARRQVFEVRLDDLRFSQAESADFLGRSGAPQLSPADITLLHQRTEGWIAGLQLAALALRHRPALLEDKQAISGRQRFITDYLSEDVLAPLQDEVRQFLLETSILTRLCGPLCAAVTGRQDSQALLKALEREGLFLMPLDDSRRWFRYHPLFAEFLQEKLYGQQADTARTLHRRAANWYLTEEMPEPAFDHAIAADDVQCVVQIFARFVNIKLPAGEFRLVQRWLEALPESWLAEYPVLELARAGLLISTGAVEGCIRCLDDVERRLGRRENGETQWQLARVTAVRCYVACFQNDLARAETMAAQALQELPEDEDSFRPGIYGALGDTYRRYGRWAEAEAAYLKVLDVASAPVVRFYSAHVAGALADLALMQGRLRAAADYWRKALAAVAEQGSMPSLPLPVVGWLYIRLAGIFYEWNELPQAWEMVARGLERAKLGGDVRALIAGYLLAARIRLTAEDIEEAEEYLERAQPLVEVASFAEWTSAYERRRLELWLAQDRSRVALSWAAEMVQSGALEERPESDSSQLAAARVLALEGDAAALSRAQALLVTLQQTAEAEGRAGVLIEAVALEALARRRHGDLAAALTTLERALRLAEPEGYVRLFADLGLPMGRLLQEARARGVMPATIDRLLAAYGDLPSALAGTPAALPEPLTPREQEVLELLAAGLSNREIGEQLVISPQTVKKHTGNIYGKLGVSSRTEAAARARELDLLD